MTVQLHFGKSEEGFFDVWRVVSNDGSGRDNEVWGESERQEGQVKVPEVCNNLSVDEVLGPRVWTSW